MDNKYFTPDIEDVRIGYECEWQSRPPDENSWGKVTFKSGYSLPDEISIKYYRVPYLTKEQIAREGFTILKKSDNNYIYAELKRGHIYDVELRYDMAHTTLAVYNIFDKTHEHLKLPAFYGECKDINTFRYVCKLLGI